MTGGQIVFIKIASRILCPVLADLRDEQFLCLRGTHFSSNECYGVI